MAGIPKTLTRTTSHAKPKHQLYQPGFNQANSCWLDGEWVTVPEAEWEERAKAHEKLYAGLRAAAAKQHHRDKATAVKDLTPAQRQAWEFFSGQETAYGYTEYGEPIGVAIDMAGTKPKQSSINFIRKRKYKLPRRVLDGKKVVDQAKRYGLPDDVVVDNEKPLDFTREVVDFNRKRQREMNEHAIESTITKGAPTDFDAFVARMAFHALIEHENDIIRAEWSNSVGQHDPYDDLEQIRAEYVEQRAKLETNVANFTEWYEAARTTHNDCARHNLGDHGQLFAFVLPKFNPDGTHEPWGPRDVPWGRTKG